MKEKARGMGMGKPKKTGENAKGVIKELIQSCKSRNEKDKPLKNRRPRCKPRERRYNRKMCLGTN